MMLDNVEFTFPQGETSIIKVIGVGGGGCNAVNNMFNKGIHDVAFVVCNTDNKALNDSVVPAKLQLGKEGLGAGNDPVAGRKAAEETIEEVKAIRHQDGLHYRRYGWRNRNRSCPGHR